jgi:hypothetical protein
VVAVVVVVVVDLVVVVVVVLVEPVVVVVVDDTIAQFVKNSCSITVQFVAGVVHALHDFNYALVDNLHLCEINAPTGRPKKSVNWQATDHIWYSGAAVLSTIIFVKII